MPKGVTLEIVGIDKVLKGLDKLPKELKQRVEGAIQDSALNIVRNAQRDAPRKAGKLAQEISQKKLNEGKEVGREIVSPKKYSAFVEFGTGAYVSVPEELAGYAAQFKGKGVKKVNLPARPFFFSNFYLEKPKLIENIKKVLKDL
jgi:HK97 gp10 family phage protein